LKHLLKSKETQKHLKQPLFSFLTVNYLQPEVTLDLVRSLQNLTYSKWELVVVNNHENPNETLQQAIEEDARNTYLESGANLGFAGGNNYGLPHCKGEYIFFINNDTEVESNLLESCLAVIEQTPKLGMLSPKIKYFQKPRLIQYAGATPMSTFTMRNAGIGYMEADEGQYDEVRETAFIHGAAMIVPRAVIDAVGPMYDDYFLYYEEYDWCARIENAGYTVMYNGKATVYHKESVSTGVDSPLKIFYLTRNRLLFARRNYVGLRRLLVWLYFSGVAVPKNVLSWLVKGRTDLARAFWRGYIWNFTNKTGA
jgi:GT2 family glycosyltransferase